MIRRTVRDRPARIGALEQTPPTATLIAHDALIRPPEQRVADEGRIVAIAAAAERGPQLVKVPGVCAVRWS